MRTLNAPNSLSMTYTFPDPPCDGIARTSPGPEGSKDKVALPGARGVLFYWEYAKDGAQLFSSAESPFSKVGWLTFW